MRGAIDYSAANAAVRAGIAELLTAGTWEQLLRAPDLHQIMAVLGGTAYAGVLDSGRADIRYAESGLKSTMALKIRRPIKFLHGGPRDLLESLFRRYELVNLGHLIRGIHNGLPGATIRESLIDMPAAAQIPWKLLSANKSISGLIDGLKKNARGRMYAGALDDAYQEYERRNNPAVLEIAASLTVYRKVRRLISRMPGKDGQDAQLLAGTELDMLNLLWAYRWRDYFGLTPEDILSYTLPEGFRVTASVVQQIAGGAALEAIVDRLWGRNLPGPQAWRHLPPGQNLVILEIDFRRYLQKKARESIGGYPFSLAVILAYMILVQNEVSDLTAIVEGKAAGRAQEDIRDRLISFGGRTWA